MKNISRMLIVPLALAGLVSSGALAVERVTGDDLKGLVSDKSWEMTVNCYVPPCITYWDWKKDGGVCPRTVNAARTGKCADEGKWQVKDDQLCWENSYFGGHYLKKQCIYVYPTSDGTFESRRTKGIGADETWFPFKVLD